MFVLRNTAVHNSGIIDKRLYNAANNEFIDIKGDFKIGNTIEWNLSLVLQLIDLVTSILSEADPHISSVLKLPTLEKKHYWYIDEEISYK